MFEVLDEFCGAPCWDQSLTWNTSAPVLTPCIEATLLSWIPCFFLWVFAPLEMYFQQASVGKALPWTTANVSRMLIPLTLALLCFINVLDASFTEKRLENMFTASITAWSLKILTFALSIVLMFINKKRGRHTSGILFLFWLCLTFFEIFIFISAFMQRVKETKVSGETAFVTKIMYFPLLIAEMILSSWADTRRPPPHFDNKDGLKVCPEQEASFPSRIFFWWFNDLCIQGWKRPLTVEDLWQLSPENRTEYVSAQFEKHSCHASELATLIGLIIDFMKSSDPIWKGALFACCLLVKGFFQSVMMSCYLNKMLTLGMRIRTVLISAIYKKSLVLSPGAKRATTTGEIINLMSVDSQRFMDLLPMLNMLWSAPLQIAVAVLMLWQVLGPSVLAGLFSMIVLIPVNTFLTSQTKKLQVKQMQSKDERVKLINEVLSGIKVLKLYAWEEAFRKKIEVIRSKEVGQLKQKANFLSMYTVIGFISPFLATSTTFATYVLVDEHHVLDAATAFVSLLLFNIMRYPLLILPDLITSMATVSVSVNRINKYLDSEELEQYVLQDPSEDSHSIVVRNGNFAWNRSTSDKAAEDGNFNLNRIHLSVQKGALVAVVGRVGSGKSSLLSAILGDMQKLGGTVSVNGTTAYVSQLPWIQNTSVQNNILFSTPLNRYRYDEVVEACGLVPDLAVFPGSDATEIGEKGINLSGGQKQRVSLARAVYSSADIYLLDDPLSAVDSHVGKHIFEKVIGPNGLLKHTTRILVTHSLTYLPQTDVVYVMKDGKIDERGSFQELMDRKSSFADFLSQYSPIAKCTEEDEKRYKSASHQNPKDLRSLTERNSGNLERSRKLSILSVNSLPWKSASAATSSSNKYYNSIEKPSIPRTDLITNLTQKETAETGQVKWTVYLSYLRAVNLVWVSVIFLSFAMWQVFAVGGNVWLSDWTSDTRGPNNTQDITLRSHRLGVYGALGLGQFLSLLIAVFSVAYETLSASNSLHQNLLSNVLRSPMSFFDTTPLGRILNRFAKDMDTMDTAIPYTAGKWLLSLMEMTSTIVVISIQTPIFLAAILPVGALYYLIQLFFVSTVRQLKRLESVTWSPIYSHFSETLAGSCTIRAYRAQDRFRLKSNELVDRNQICCYPTIVSSRWLAIRLDFCGNCVIFFAALFAVLQRDHLDAGRAGLSVAYALMITISLNCLVNMSCAFETAIVAVERVLEYTTTETEAEWIVESKRPSDDWPLKGEIQMDNYSTRYRKGLDLVLKGISCDIKSGEKVGIVGRTGAGKSSLTLSLFRIIEASGGSIRIDGLDTADMGLHDLRSKITIIPQDPVLFSGSLRMNLDPFSSYSDEKVWQALSHAHLQGFVSSLNSGLMHDIVEGGENLSVGQRQLVCLARALLRKTQILVLDEATAAVDLETDDLLQATIRREFATATVLTIAHRLNTVMDYDRIMVLEDGRVVEFEAPDVLKRDKKSVFNGMARDAGLV